MLRASAKLGLSAGLQEGSREEPHRRRDDEQQHGVDNVASFTRVTLLPSRTHGICGVVWWWWPWWWRGRAQLGPAARHHRRVPRGCRAHPLRLEGGPPARGHAHADLRRRCMAPADNSGRNGGRKDGERERVVSGAAAMRRQKNESTRACVRAQPSAAADTHSLRRTTCAARSLARSGAF